jgi:D-serine deaminase-like pyridoxal phosphate-dependent protein
MCSVQVPVVTGAGTGSFMLEGASGVYDEVQPGSYIWLDTDYGANTDTGCMFEHALFIAATVMSHATPVADTVVLDAGMKAIDFVCGPPQMASTLKSLNPKP